LLTTAKVGSSGKAAMLCAASVVGIVISLTGFRVQRIEGVYFAQAREVFAKEYRKVYPDEQPPYRAQKPNKSILRLISSCLLGKAGVRDHFQILFLAFTIVFAAIAVYACVSL
jgi:hypothetical protein